MSLAQRVTDIFDEGIQLGHDCAELLVPVIVDAAHMLVECLLAGHKILTCGNGGSAAEAQHFSSEMLNRFEMERPGLPAITLTTDASTLTSIANDDHFAEVFAKQIRALGQPGDMLLALTTSGASPNIINAVRAAHDREMRVLLLSGRGGGPAAEQLTKEDLEIRIPSVSTARTQEMHLVIIHSLCDLIDRRLLGQEA